MSRIFCSKKLRLPATVRYPKIVGSRWITSAKIRLDIDKGKPAEWKDKANVLVIGGGAVGTSLAYHLAKKGMKDVVLLEKTELTAGSTWHAAGLTAYYNGATNMKKAHYYAIQLLNAIEKETGQEIGFHKPGSIRLAETPTRVDELKYQLTRAQWHQAPIELITPDRIAKLHPLLNMKNVLAGLYNPGDGHVDPYSLTQAYAAGARKYGAQIVQACDVTATNLKQNGKWEVQTNKGTIVAGHVVNAAGLWAREVGKLAGITLPIIPAHHQYVVTSTIPEVAALDFELPVIRDLEGSYYLRQERKGILYGVYEATHKMLLCDDWYDNGPPKGFGKELFQPDLDRISVHSEKAMDLVPCLQKANIQTVVSGPITYGPDVYPQIGPFQGLHNYWVSVAHTYGIVHSAGFGDYLSHWIIYGEPPYENIETDPNRYSPSWCTEKYHLAKARETYGMNNAVAYPKEVRFAGRPTSRTTPIYDLQKNSGAQFSISSGWEVADWYAKPDEDAEYKPSFRRTNWFKPVGRECKAVLESCGVIDLSPFGKFEVTGPDAELFVDYVYANDVPQNVGEIKVSHMLTSRGTVYGEHTVSHVSPGTFWCITGAGSELHDLRWMETVARNKQFNVTFKNITEQYCVISIAGPRSRDLMNKLTDHNVSAAAWPFMTKQECILAGVPVIGLRLSYTGELGWELYVKRENMLALYQAILEAGKQFNLTKFGKYAMDSLRQEKGMRSWGNEMTSDSNALEAGLGMFLKPNKPGEFIGKSALHETKKAGLKKKLVFMTLDSKDCDPNGDETVWHNGQVVGFTTSGSYGWQVGSSICMAKVPVELAEEGKVVQVEMLGDKYNAVIHKQPLVKHESRR